MSDSLQKIIDDLGFLASDIAAANINGFGNQVLALQARLEALQKQPVAWMEPKNKYLCLPCQKFMDKRYYDGYTMPLIKAR